MQSPFKVSTQISAVIFFYPLIHDVACRKRCFLQLVVKNGCLKAKADRVETTDLGFFAPICSSRAHRHAQEWILKLSWNFVHAELLDVLDGESV